MTTTIITADGDVTIEEKLFASYYNEGATLLGKQASLAQEFKILIDTVAENTEMKPSVVSGYFKARYKAETDKAKGKGDLYDALDGLLDEQRGLGTND